MAQDGTEPKQAQTEEQGGVRIQSLPPAKTDRNEASDEPNQEQVERPETAPLSGTAGDGGVVPIQSESEGESGSAGGVDLGMDEPVKAPIFSTKSEEVFSTKESSEFSTKEKPNLRLVFSTKNSPQNEAQIELIKTANSGWKYIKGKPPYPPKHALNPSGRKQIGRRVSVGYEILRRAECEQCGKEMRLTAGYISATQLLGLERESNETKIGIVKNILRKKAGSVDERLINLRCTGCCLGGERGGLSAVGA